MIRIRTMTQRDIVLGMRLKAQAGWNQLPADWERFLAMEPTGCFVAEWQTEPVATTVACLFGSVAWIAMVLVDQSMRGQGIGSALMRHAIAFAEGHGVTTIRLDATPLGQPVYEKLGFRRQYVLHRYAGQLQPLPQATPLDSTLRLRRAAEADEPRILALDQLATNTDREKFLRRLLREQPDGAAVIERGDELQGYLAVRPGSAALQLGPCIAAEAAGEQLLHHACQQFAGRHIFIDVPEANQKATSLVQRAGLTSQRPLLRMVRGPDVCDYLTLLWASSGPELG